MNYIENVFGGTLIGVFITSFVWSVLTCMTWRYFDRFPQDWWAFKWLVGSFWALQVFHMFVSARAIYVYVILNYGRPEKLAVTIWEYNISALTSTISVFLVQAFFVWRVFLFSRMLVLDSYIQAILIPIIALLSIVQLGFGIVCTIQGFKLKEFAKFRGFTWGVILWYGSGSVCNILISASMCTLLARSRTGLPKTDRLINRLMTYSVETGLAPSIVEVILFSTFCAYGLNFAQTMLSILLSSLYGISLLANLLARNSPGSSIVEFGGTLTNPFVLSDSDRESQALGASAIAARRLSNDQPLSGMKFAPRREEESRRAVLTIIANDAEQGASSHSAA